MIPSINPVSLASRAILTAARPIIQPLLPPMPVAIGPQAWPIDFSKDIIVLWVPGTNNHAIPPKFSHFAESYWGKNAQITLVDYASSWHFAESVPEGIKNLKSALDFIKKNRRPGQKVYIAAESQGALVTGQVISDPAYKDLFDKAVLLGHPGIAPQHFHKENRKVLEINNALDPTTFEWEGDYENIIKAVDKLAQGDVTSIPFLIKTALNNPTYAILLTVLQIQQIGIFKRMITNTHNYEDRLQFAVLWLEAR